MDIDDLGSAISTGIGLGLGIGVAGIALKATSDLADQMKKPQKKPKISGGVTPKLPKIKAQKIPKVPKYGGSDYFSPEAILARQRGK